MKADVILTGKSIFDGKEFSDIEKYIAIKDEKIISVGKIDEKDKFISNETKIYDCGDKLIMPGFHDNHNHIYLSMIFSNAVFLGSAKSENDVIEMLREGAKAQEGNKWILGYGWHQAKWDNPNFPTKESLDTIFPDTPVFLMHETGHAAWVNSLVLYKFGIDKDTPDPHNGAFERDEKGNPTGFILEDAYLPFAEEAFKLDAESEKVALDKYLKEKAELGITSVDDMFYIMGLNLGNPDLYSEYEKNGKLSMRINFYIKESNKIEDLCEYEKYKSPKVNFRGVKIFLDGVASTYTAFMVDEYANRSDFVGYPFHTEEQLFSVMKCIDSANYKMRAHAVGDGAVRLIANAYERLVKENGKKDRRLCIEHIEIIHPDDISRLGELEIIPSIQPNHMAITKHLPDNPFLTFLGEKREPYFWMGKTLIDACSAVTYGTDFPISKDNPMLTVFRAVNRVMDDMEPKGGWNPKEKASLAEALRCYTYNGAYSNFQEDELGTLEVGKYADIVVLDRNIFAEEPLKLKDVSANMTISAGKVVYEKEQA